MKLTKPKNIPTSDELLETFLETLDASGVQPYDHQEEAILELYAGNNVILNTPTGSGKSLVATALHYLSLSTGRSSYYTVPIKALANEKFIALCNTFGPENVGMITGDATVNPHAPIICCTAEILSNLALREGDTAKVHDIIMDEFHYYSDTERGIAWQIPLLTLPQSRFLLMSATIGDTEFFQKEITNLTGTPTTLVQSDQRPVPLEFTYSEIPLTEQVTELVEKNKAPVYLVHFAQRATAESAQALLSSNFCTKDEKREISVALQQANFRSPYGKEISKILRNGIGIHHAGLLPKYRVLVEKLAQRGLLKVICGTDTLGVGVNVPIRSVLFTQLCKYDGSGTKTLTVRDFKQIAGRAGRRGFDDIGFVIAQAPEHVVENIRLEAKAAASPKNKKIVKKKPPENGFVMWTEETFQKLITSPPEPLKSSFNLRHNTILNTLARQHQDGCQALKNLIENSHETPLAKTKLRQRAREIFIALVRGKVLTIIPPAERSFPQSQITNHESQIPSPTGDTSINPGVGDPGHPSNTPPRQATDPATPPHPPADAHPSTPNHQTTNHQLTAPKVALHIDLQEDFTMNQALGLYLLEAIPQLDREAPEYSLNLLTLVEAILEHPAAILKAQINKIKSDLVAQMKADGVEYDDRMDRLEQVTHPMPGKDFIYDTFNRFRDKHPWIGEENIRPKNIAREMFENFLSFDDYIRDYKLERSEAILLRHLSEVYKVLAQTVPPNLKTPEVLEAEEYLKEHLTNVDSSLIDEWEKLKNPDYTRPVRDENSNGVTHNKTAFAKLLHTATFEIVKYLAHENIPAILERIDPRDSSGEPWTTDRFEKILDHYYLDHTGIRLDPEARNKKHHHSKPLPETNQIQINQTLIDPDNQNNYTLTLLCDLTKTNQLNTPHLTLESISPLEC